MLKEGKIEAKEWNEKYMPAIDLGFLKVRSNLKEDGFLMIYEIFNAIIEDEDGSLYNVTAWSNPSDDPHVIVSEYIN